MLRGLTTRANPKGCTTSPGGENESVKSTFAFSRPLGGRDYSEALNESDFSPAIDPTDRLQNSPQN
jgi:hypothetical protein